MKIFNTFVIALAGFVLSVPVSGACNGTESCTFLTSSSEVANLESAISPYACSTAFMADAWSVLKLEVDWWDDGWGYHQPCNVLLPLSRIHNAAYVISHVTPSWWNWVDEHLEIGNHNIRLFMMTTHMLVLLQLYL